MTQQTPITQGSRVVLHFSLSLDDGTKVISTFSEDPMAFTLGDGTMEPTLESKLIGLTAGDEQSLILDGNDIYGARIPENIEWIDIAEFPDTLSLAQGQIIAFTTPEGDEVAGTVDKIETSRVAIDFNHPLSGRTIIFTTAILRVEDRE